MSTIKDKVMDAAHTVAEKATQAAEFVKDKAEHLKEKMGFTDIKPHMSVVGSCGNNVGKVDHVEGDAIKLTRNDSPDGKHHFIPKAWVNKVEGETVWLSKNSMEAKQGWKDDAAACC